MTVHPDLRAHADRFQPEIWQSGERVYTAFGYNIASVSMIEGDEGLILIDTAAQEVNAGEIWAAFQKISTKPIKAIIYTHFHNDHVNGVGGFVTPEQVAAEGIQIYAHAELMRFIAGIAGYLAPLMGRRASYQFGAALPRDATGFVHAGLGLPHNPGPRSFIAPTHTVRERTALRVCGVDLELVPLPGESDDHLGVWLPHDKVLLTGDTIQGECLPNVYTLRGTPYRDPMQWVRTLDRVRDDFDAQIVIPHHGRRLVGRAQIEEVVTAYRDAIQFIHDQTIRGMNKGLAPADIARDLRLPPHLAEHPWLGEFYGSIKHIVPAIAAGTVGWFYGDPVALDPLPTQDRATRHLTLMGGAAKVAEETEGALAAQDWQWALELAGYLVSADPNSTHKALKARALRHWGWAQSNPTWRNWALTAALELDPPKGTQPQYAMAPPGVVRAFPPALMLRTMTVRLKAEETQNMHLKVGFRIPEIKASYALEIRRGVCQFHEVAGRCDAYLTVPRQFFIDLALRKTSWSKALADGTLAQEGDLQNFFSYFEAPSKPGEINFVLK